MALRSRPQAQNIGGSADEHLLFRFVPTVVVVFCLPGWLPERKSVSCDPCDQVEAEPFSKEALL